MKKVPDFARRLHRVSGLVLAAILIIMGLSGSLLVFKEDYLRLTLPAARRSVDLSASGLAQTARQAEEKFGADTVRLIVFATPKLALHKVYLADGQKGYLDADGSIVDQWRGNGRAEEWLFDLHHHLLAGATGQWVAGMAALGGTVFVLAGVIAFWPARRGFRRGLTLTSLKRPDMLFFHRNLGIIAAPIIIALLLTGAILAFPLTSRAVLDIFGTAPKSASTSIQGVYEVVDWDPVIRRAKERFPDAQIRMASWPQPDSPAYLRVKQPAEWHPNGRTKLTISISGTQLAHVEDALKIPVTWQAYNAVYPTHAAFIGGRTFDLIVALGGLSMALLGSIASFTYLRKLMRGRQLITRPESKGAP